MLFNSYAFLFAFLPVALAGYVLLGRRSVTLAAGWLTLASLFFYGWWDARYLPLLLGSILFNYATGRAIAARAGRPAAGRLLALGIGADLALLVVYKYSALFIDSANRLAGLGLPVPELILPLGISFFTFTQIAFLVDAWAGKVHETRLVHYALFVTYFPHLIAGPVLHHGEMMSQFEQARNYRLRLNNVLIGSSIFVFGLAKKVLLADNLAPLAGAVFEGDAHPGLLTAWGGVLAYTFQLYFDFSGYSDMAIGLSRLFGVKLPLNFDSPYKAATISDFWRRWHMTLSRFLRDYLYIPLGGNKHGPVRRYANLMTTMLLGGLWHGAGWNFLLWGGLHGAYLCVQHAWSARFRLPQPLAVALTFVAVVVAWVFFRATTLHGALDLLAGMAGLHGVALPEAVGRQIGGFAPMLTAAGIRFHPGGGEQFVTTWGWVTVAALIAFLCPNTQQIHARLRPAIERVAPSGGLRFRLSRRWAVGLGLASTVCVLSLSRPSEFLYFQF
jgi:alginate O-acetyltransferase complex protein AlgI